MNIAKCTAFVLLAGLPVAGNASEQWSSCQTVTAITNYMAYSNPSLGVVLSPGLPGCTANDAIGGVAFVNGQLGVSTDALKSLLASLISAQLSGTRVMVYYDNTTSTCTGKIVSVGGYSAQCL